MSSGFLRALLACAIAGGAWAQPESAPVRACATLGARLTADQAGAAARRDLDTTRIQAALNLCSPGRAVVLEGSGDRRAFASAPLILPRAVTLLIEEGVTLYASRNPRDYDLAPASCGAPPPGKAATCKPFLYSYQAAFSGVSGGGAIDGQGRRWWDLARAAGKSGRAIAVPDLVSSYESQGFHLEGITLRNAAGVHASIYKTTAFTASAIRIESPEDAAASTGMLLSNALDATVTDAWIRVPAAGIALKASILGATAGVRMRGIHLFGGRGFSIGDATFGAVRGVTVEGLSIDGARVGLHFDLKGAEGGEARDIRFAGTCLRHVAEAVRVEGSGAGGSTLPAGRNIDPGEMDPACVPPAFSSAPKTSFTVDRGTVAVFGRERALVVAADGTARFTSVQQAVDALPAGGGDITIKPGTYREVVTIRKPHVRLHGDASGPALATIVFNNGPPAGGTFASATVFVEADDAAIDHLTIANDLGVGKGQGVALAVTADRAAFRNVRLLGAQDTLFAASRYCYGDYGPCAPARQYFADSYIEGDTDFIFGDSLALFERSELHGLAEGNVMYTAHSRHTADQRASAYVFDHCRLTGEARASGTISLGRPWRPYATVIFLNTQMDAPVIPEGWTEWLRFGKPSLPTAYYAECNSAGRGANPRKRERWAHPLTGAEAERWSGRRLLAGKDGWNPRGR